MARRGPGRPAKTLEQHLRDGTYKPSRHGPVPSNLVHLRYGGSAGSAAKAGLPPLEKPEGLSEVAAAMWDRIMATCPGLAHQSDRDTLVMLCEWYALWKEALVEARACEPKEKVRVFTALGIASTNFERIAKKFGFSPKDRAALGVSTEPAQAGPKVSSRPKTSLDDAGPPPEVAIGG